MLKRMLFFWMIAYDMFVVVGHEHTAFTWRLSLIRNENIYKLRNLYSIVCLKHLQFSCIRFHAVYPTIGIRKRFAY